MKPILSWSLLTAFLLMMANAVFATENSVTAEGVMQRMHGRLPEGPLEISGQLTSKSPDGDILQTYEATIVYTHTNNAFSAELLLKDAFGSKLEKMVVTGIGTTNANYSYFKGEDLDPHPTPDLEANIGRTDFRWQDLTLSFLWWPDGNLTGKDSLKGRQCYVIDIANPEPDSPIQAARLWIDAEMHVLLRAKFYDAENSLKKRFDVKSFSKTDDLWMAKDLDIRSYPSHRRTSLRVRHIEQLSKNDRTDR